MSKLPAPLRGLVFLGIGIVIIGACLFFTFGVMPGSGTAVALPVIMVPGEPYDPYLPDDGWRWTNTLTATVLASLLVLIFAGITLYVSKNLTKQVPGRWQSFVELLYGGFYNFGKGFAGKNIRLIYPLAATLFVFLLATNWMKLLPGVETVGVMHCAEEGFSGYPATQWAGSFRLYVDEPLNAGADASHDSYYACSNFFHHGDLHFISTPEQRIAAADQIRDQEATLRQNLAAEGITDAAVIEAEVAALRLSITETVYEKPTFGLSEKQMRDGAFPYIFVVTPFVRGATTDLNLTIGLALVAVVAVQFFGIWKQKGAYLEKFVNLSAIGNAGKNPIGGVNFVVGLFEIVSEIGKIVSLAFRLFGNMFAGGILLIVMTFLVGMLLPAVFIGLEVIITTVQALVFALLTLIFASQAMEGHHGDDHGDGHEEHHA